jgi:hypothetical protein
MGELKMKITRKKKLVEENITQKAQSPLHSTFLGIW